MDLSPAEVVGHTCYHFIHVEDLDTIRQSHEDCEPPFLFFLSICFSSPSFFLVYSLYICLSLNSL